MGNCGTCKHRGHEPAVVSWKTPVQTFFECTRVEHQHTYYEVPGGARAVLLDGSNYRAVLCVQDSYGCVLWEPR